MANFIRQLALVSESKKIKLAEVTRVAAALDKQATRDFAPIWGINSSIHAFARLEERTRILTEELALRDVAEPSSPDEERA